MKRRIYLFVLMIAVLAFNACKDDSDDDKKDEPTVNTGTPGKITITQNVDANVLTVSASADNATGFSWDFGNNQVANGADAVQKYYFGGTYTVKCTALGREADRDTTFEVTVAPDPDVFSDVNILLSGYNEETKESEALWGWTKKAGAYGVGPVEWSGDSVYFGGQTIWWSTPEEGYGFGESGNDRYSFKLNEGMEYINDFGGDGFIFHWTWEIHKGVQGISKYGSIPLPGYVAPAASWSVKHIANLDTISFQTQIGDELKDGVYVIQLTNDAKLGMGTGVSDYQILSLTKDTLKLRFDSTVPDGFDNAAFDLSGDSEFSYLTLIKREPRTAEEEDGEGK